MNTYIDTAYKALVESVLERDFSEQREFMSVIQEQRNIDVDYLLDRGCIFIPNAEYVRYHIGSLANNPLAGFYHNENPLWQLHFILPIMDLTGAVVGIVGWDAYNKYKVSEGEALSLPTYKVSTSLIFDRSKYFFTDTRLMESCYRGHEEGQRAIFIVDGVFDSVSLCEKGIPAISLLGSNLSQTVAFMLKFYDFIYVIHDNDSAGINLFQQIKRKCTNVFAVKQTHTKDIEERIRDDAKVVETLKSLLNSPVKEDVWLDKRRMFG